MARVDTDLNGSIDFGELAAAASQVQAKLTASVAGSDQPHAQQQQPTPPKSTRRRRKKDSKWTHSELLSHSLSTGVGLDVELARSRRAVELAATRPGNDGARDRQAEMDDAATSRLPFDAPYQSAHKKRHHNVAPRRRRNSATANLIRGRAVTEEEAVQLDVFTPPAAGYVHLSEDQLS
eukprot:COSAG05_NODE_9010_length_655_cov_0.496403_1_plen_178_part_10